MGDALGVEGGADADTYQNWNHRTGGAQQLQQQNGVGRRKAKRARRRRDQDAGDRTRIRMAAKQLRNGMDAVQRGVTRGNGSGGNTSARRTRTAATTNEVDDDDNDEGVEARVGAQGASERKEKEMEK